VANAVIAEEVEVTPTTVRAWRKAFGANGLAGLGKIREGRGRKPSIPKETVAEIVRLTTTTTPPGATHWSCRTMAAQLGSVRLRCNGFGRILACSRIESTPSRCPMM